MTFRTHFTTEVITVSSGTRMGFYLTEENIGKLHDIEKAIANHADEIILDFYYPPMNENTIYYAISYPMSLYDTLGYYNFDFARFICYSPDTDKILSSIFYIDYDLNNKPFFYSAI